MQFDDDDDDDGSNAQMQYDTCENYVDKSFLSQMQYEKVKKLELSLQKIMKIIMMDLVIRDAIPYQIVCFFFNIVQTTFDPPPLF